MNRFEDIVAWQKARDLNKKIYELTSRNDLVKDFALRDQIRKASISIMANIAEGFERGGSKEFSQFLSIAKGSAAEVKSHLYAAKDLSYVSESNFSELYASADEVSKIIAGLMKYLSHSSMKGRKYQ